MIEDWALESREGNRRAEELLDVEHCIYSSHCGKGTDILSVEDRRLGPRRLL